jgi:hypothetical protein
MSTTTNSSGGVGFLGLLTIVFITLKLIGYVSWSWWWVLAPMWIPLVTAVILFGIAAVLSAKRGW